MADPVSTVPIPDEAWDAAGKLVYGFAPKHEDLPNFVAKAIEAAAPFIARAAQVQVLQVMAVEFDDAAKAARLIVNQQTDDLSRRHVLTTASSYERAATRLRERADELERRR